MDAERRRRLSNLAGPARSRSEAVRQRLEDLRRRITDAADRGLTEAAVPIVDSTPEAELVRRALTAGGFGLAPVVGEDGSYSVVYW